MKQSKCLTNPNLILIGTLRVWDDRRGSQFVGKSDGIMGKDTLEEDAGYAGNTDCI